jgi:large subunit ribosomal protein L9
MELILKETIATLGQEGDVVRVKPGFGRNFLLPQGKAILATPENLAALESRRAEIKARLASEKQIAEGIATKIAALNVVIEQLAGDDERLFGSVTSADICAKLAELGVAVDKKQVVLPEAIKTLGQVKVPVKVGFNVQAELTVTVAPLKA